MASSERPFWTSLPARILMTVIVIGVLAALMIPTGGKPDDSNGDDDEDKEVTNVPVESGCTRDLRRILGGIAPGRLGISTGAGDLAVELNRWFAKCGEDNEEEFSQDSDLQKQLFDQDLFEELQEQRFLPEDIAYVRMSLLARDIVTNVTNDLQSNTNKVVSLFEFVCNNIILVNSQNSTIAEIPATPYQSFVWGMGTAEHRAWAFATLLRQLRIDAFLITSQSETEKWLFGVNIPKEGILLFDTKLGLPVSATSSSEEPIPQTPATLDAVRMNDELLEQFSLPDFNYPLTSADFEKVSIKIIGEPSLWANRLARLQFMITPIETVLLYDGIGPNVLREGGGQRKRIIELGKKNNLWDEQAVEIWKFPLEQTQAYSTAQQDPENNLQTLEAIFAGPQLLKIDPLTRNVAVDPLTGASIFAAAKSTLHAVRIEQLRGEHQDALQHFGPILTSYKTNPSPLNEEAATFAALWIGVSQLETKRLSAAESSFDRFTSTLRQSQTQIVPIELLQQNAYFWKALAQLEQNDLTAAIETLIASQTDEKSHRDAWLIKRWDQLANQ